MTPEDVDRVAVIADPVIRNLRITQAYHELSAAAAARLGPVANWCTFATWASKQAGRTIRGEDLERALEEAFRSSPATAGAAREVGTEARRFGASIPLDASLRSVWALIDPAAALDRASASVARGNLRVFQEIGREFARFDVEGGAGAGADADALARFVERLRPGEPPDGQRYLRDAFLHYHRAALEVDLAMRAQLMLLANLEVGFHEQTRLQPEIEEALDAGVVDPRDVRDQVVAALFPQATWLVRLRLFVARLLGRRSLLDIAVDALVVEMQRLVRRILTRHLMSIDLGNAVRLQLGKDLGAGFPPSLREIVVPELRELLDRIDPTPDSQRESGAADWADLGDRVHFIADMFRCFQESPFLFDPPFTPAQVERLDAGERPAGPL
jgi:hypothetical protein